MIRMWVTRLAVALFLMAGAASNPVAMQERADLTGSWKLNAERSSTTSGGSVDREMSGRRSPVGGSGMPIGGGGPGSFGGASGTGGSRPDPENLAKAREGLRLAMLTSERLTIIRDGTSFVMTDSEGVSCRWSPDGKTTKSEVGALTVETKVKWDAAVLVIERKFEGGVKATDRYSVTGNPRQLVIASKIENTKVPGDRDRTFQRVYDAEQ
jgi:hypothetical protein